MNELEQLMADLNRIEALRETARRTENWDCYQACCERLCNIGRRLELLRMQSDTVINEVEHGHSPTSAIQDTPRTDREEENLRAIGGRGYVTASHARELERELAETKQLLAHKNEMANTFMRYHLL